MTALSSFWYRLDTWVQVWCIVLFALFLLVLVVMLIQLARARRRAIAISGKFAKERPEVGEERRDGRTLRSFERLRDNVTQRDERGAELWGHIEQIVEEYESPHGRTGYFLTQPAHDVITPDVVWRGFPITFYRAVPGVLTSLGLLGTFVALLLGLNGLDMDGSSGTVVGLPNLIANLSGKFLTSIVALSLGVIFLLIEVVYCQPQLRVMRARVVRAVHEALPLLTEARILLDIQRQSVKQATALGHISADVVERFSHVFREDLAPLFAAGISSSMANQLQAEMGPTFQQLSSTMQNLTATVERLEQTKRESVVGELRGLVDSLESTLRETLGNMASQFQQALTGSTQQEFGALAEVIKGSAEVVGQMSTNLSLVQSALQTVVEEAKKSTNEQMVSGVEQTQRLNMLVEGLMVRLNETANQNYEQLTGTLTYVVTSLSEKVTALSNDLVSAVGSATERSQDAATHTLKQANDWSNQTSQQINDLLSTLGDKVDGFDRAGETLLAAQGVLRTTLGQNHEALAALGAAAGEVRTYTNSLAGLQRQIDEGHKTQNQLALITRESVNKLVEAAGRHDEFLRQYHGTFEAYRGVFEGLDTQIAAVLEAILERVQQYNRSVEQNFRAIVTSANEVMPRMANTLKGSTDDLKDQLDELSDVLEKSTKRLAGVPAP